MGGRPYGQYELIRRLGKGGMAEVFLARRTGPSGFEKQLVIKRLLPHLSQSDDFRALFLKEARIAARLEHPHLAHVSDFGEVDGSYFLAMEHVDGLTLAHLLASCGTLDADLAVVVAIDVLRALAYIHGATDEDCRALGLVHRDVTPRNVMLTRDGSTKLLDLGIAVTHDDATPRGFGTPGFTAPEQRAGGRIDHRADLYSVGALLHTMLTGGPPSSPPTGEVPPGLQVVISSLLQPNPGNRLRNAQEVIRTLESYQAETGSVGARTRLGNVVDTVAGEAQPAGGLTARLTAALKSTGLLGRRGAAVRWVTGGTLVAALAAALGFWFLLPVEPLPSVPAHAVEPVVVPPVVVEPPAPKPVEAKSRAPVRKTGLLTVLARPWVAVTVNGRRVADETPLKRYRVKSGKAVLVVENPVLGFHARRSITIRPKQETRVFVDVPAKKISID